MTISDQLDIQGEKILLAGFRSHQNMGDELILVGNVRLLQQQGKEIFIVAHDPLWMKSFLRQFLDITDITFLQELPRGIRSSRKYFTSNIRSQIKTFRNIDTIILGGGEILTEESAHSYYYRLWSIRPALFCKKTLYLMGGIQIPKKRINRVLCKWIFRHTKKIYTRDKEEISAIQKFEHVDVEFFMDTSYFAVNNRKSYKHHSDEKYIIININTKGLKFLPELCEEIIHYAKQGYTSTYIPVSRGSYDDDARHFITIQKMLPTEYSKFLKKKDRETDFLGFLQYLGGAKKVISTRLHLFLISEFIGIETHVFPYQKKINKMKHIIKEYHGIF